jgi:hypothetical protein
MPEDGFMDRGSLKPFLTAEGIDPESYTLDDATRDEAYVLDQRGRQWVVYYSERGLETGLEHFDAEDAACRHLMDLLLRDSTTRLK